MSGRYILGFCLSVLVYFNSPVVSMPTANVPETSKQIIENVENSDDFLSEITNTQNLARDKRESYAKVVLEAVRDGTGIFAAYNGAITAAIPNPATGIAAAAGGVISAITAVIASRID